MILFKRDILRGGAAAIGALLHPHAEVVVHDLGSGRIAGSGIPFPGRRVGDDR